MALSFGNTGGATFGSSGFASLGAKPGSVQAQSGPDLEEIQTEGLGFHALAGDAKVQLFPTAWPDDALPPPTSSLLAVASNKGLLAAAGPSSVIVASTQSVRQAFGSDDGGSFKAFTPQLTIEPGTRISQVAFSSDESMLVLSAEHGGGLAIYSVDNILQGNNNSAFEMGTDGASLRSLIPNPAAEHAELFAVVTVNGQLLLANMKERQLISGPNGPILKEGVSSISWSNKGKQLTAGLGNGAALQMKPDGQVVKEIPRPPGLDDDQHVSAISWLENDIFIIAHTPSNDDGTGMIPATTYHQITRDKDGNCVFQRSPEICSPFGLNRSPPFQFIQRLREFPPDLKDMVIVSSTASEEIGVFTRATRSLAGDSDPSRLTNVFTTTSMANDSRRAQLPMSEDMTSNTSPIGMALDLSSKTNVHRPLPGEEIDESQGPLPALLILNNLGALSAWWIAYAVSIRNGTHYPGLTVYAGQQHPQSQSQPQTSAAVSAFGQSSLGPKSLGSTAPAPSFGAPAMKPATLTFGSTNSLGAAEPAFGNPSALGGAKPAASAFGTASTLGAATPSFGNASAIGGAKPAFGSASGLGTRSSPWASSTPQQSGGASFGQPAFGSASGIGQKSSPWASSTSTGTAFGQTPQSSFSAAGTPAAGSGGGFASFANTGGFAAAAAKSGSGSVLQQSTPNKLFGSEMDTGSAFTPTPKKDEKPAGSIFGLGPSGFQLESAWKNENAGKDGQPNTATRDSLFNSDFGKALGDASAQPSVAPSTEADMSDTSDGQVKEAGRSSNPESPIEPTRETTTPADTPAPTKFTLPANKGLFGTQSQNEATPAAEVQKSKPTPSIFGEHPGPVRNDSTPVIKKEPVEEDAKPSEDSETPSKPPVPPDTTSKATYTPGTSSAASSASASKQSAGEAPLPPDFLSSSSKTKATTPANAEPPASSGEDTPLPPDFVKPKQRAQPPPQTPTDAPLSFTSEGSELSEPEESSGEATALPDGHDDLDDEGSGVDVGNEISGEPSLKVTPESSFGGKHDTGGPFAKISQPQPQPAHKSLFGEVGKGSMPVFPPPSKLQESPRSPSPVRSAVPMDMLRPDNQRSVSAPDMAPPKTNPRRSIIEVRKPEKSFSERQREGQERLAREKERQRQEEEQPLSDQEDEEVRRELAAPIQPSLEVGPFHAHQDYVGNVTKPGIAGQIEKLYRDINSMIDVLGLNSRKLQAFTKGHAELLKESGRDKDDLTSSESWTLVEIEDLSTLETTLAHELEQGRLHNVDSKSDDCASLAQDLSKLRARQTDFKRTIDARTNPENLSAQRLTPLSAEQSIQRHDLRRDFSTFQTNLAKAEEAISVLRARLAALPSSSPSKHKPPKKVPTVEAVENTIRKMTAMAERKSGDIDVLETQMRRLGLGGGRPSSAGSASLLLLRSAGPGQESPSSSRASSPGNFVTPPSSARKSLRGSVMEGNGIASARSNAPFYTPRSSRLGDSMMSSGYAGGSPGKSPRRKVDEISKEEARAYGERMARRMKVKRAVRDVLAGRGAVEVRDLRRD